MATNLDILLAGTLTITDTTLTPNAQIWTRSLNNPKLSVTLAAPESFLQIAAASSPVTINFPAGVTTIFLLYVRHLGNAGNLTVTFTPTGGAPTDSPLILPGGIFLVFNTAESAGGITALTLTASAGTIPVEVLMGS